jgi:hypothetical protein
MANQGRIVPSRGPTKAGDRNALVVLSWGSLVWYRRFPLQMTIGELRRQLAKELGCLFDREVVGLELFSTGTNVVPDLALRLHELTYPPYRNVCLDVTGGPDRPHKSSNKAFGEHLLQKHLCNKRFQAGVAQRLWRLIRLEWPYGIFGIRSTKNADYEIALRLNLEKYPLAPPSVQLWDITKQTVIEPQHWPESFCQFVTTTYPEIVDIVAENYAPKLLNISAAVAQRRKLSGISKWDITQDLTQLLSQASACFRFSTPSDFDTVHD